MSAQPRPHVVRTESGAELSGAVAAVLSERLIEVITSAYCETGRS